MVAYFSPFIKFGYFFIRYDTYYIKEMYIIQTVIKKFKKFKEDIKMSKKIKEIFKSGLEALVLVCNTNQTFRLF